MKKSSRKNAGRLMEKMIPLEALQKLREPDNRSELNLRIMVQPGEKNIP